MTNKTTTTNNIKSQVPALLMLENGRVFHGYSFGGNQEKVGEVVFNTSLTGYQEVLSDPSYSGQIVVFTAVQIGNTGVNEEDREAKTPRCVGLVVKENSPVSSSWRADEPLDAYMSKQGMPGIEGIDTRALTRVLRDEGAQKGIISTQVEDLERLKNVLAKAPGMKGQDLASKVTCESAHEFKETSWVAPDIRKSGHASTETKTAFNPHVIAFDFGVKSSILKNLKDVGCKVTVLPSTASVKDAMDLNPSGFFLSNGPGDPAAVSYAVETVKGLINTGKPIFGICLGHQILSLALGAETYKLQFGHHGGNHPVMDLKTGKVAITSHNHGFAVKQPLPDHLEMTHKNLYDGTVEGFKVKGKPIMAIQYHPEASPGPHDACYLFQEFAEMMK